MVMLDTEGCFTQNPKYKQGNVPRNAFLFLHRQVYNEYIESDIYRDFMEEQKLNRA